MRLINYGVGEITDRLSILALKILYGRQAARGVDHFVQERNALLGQLRGRTLNGAWFEQALELGAVNGALWRAEDELRAMRGNQTFETVAGLAFRIQTLNDERARLVGEINKLTGEHHGEEKV